MVNVQLSVDDLSGILAVMSALWLLPRMRVRAKPEVADEEELAASPYYVQFRSPDEKHHYLLFRRHSSEIMFGVLVVVFCGDRVATLGFSSGERQIPLIVSLRIGRARRCGPGT